MMPIEEKRKPSKNEHMATSIFLHGGDYDSESNGRAAKKANGMEWKKRARREKGEIQK